MSIKGMMLAATALLSALPMQAQIPSGYYDALRGKKGAELKTAIHELIKKANVLDYGKGKGSTWWGFYTTDNDNGYVIDRYSNERRAFNSQGSSVSGMNIEHSLPKSWWGGQSCQAYNDLFNLMPSDSKANSAKNNFGMGVVTSATFDNKCIQVGKSGKGYSLWQPSTTWEGDFARDYMYMVTAYQDYEWTHDEALHSLQNNTYPTLQPWAYTLYIQWAKEDPVSDVEVKRNNAVYAIQGNRNPYIDFPNLMEYVWGDSTDVAFDPSRTATSEHYNGGSTPQPGEETVYTANFKSTKGDCTIASVSGPEDIWKRSAAYGWVGTGYMSGTRQASDCSLLTPELDLTQFETAKVAFAHAVNFLSSPASALSVEVRVGGEAHALEGIVWPAGNSWTFIESGDVDLTAYCGQKIQLAFHYTSTASVAGTWEIRDIAVTGRRAATHIGAATVSAGFDISRPYTTYSLDGRLLPNNVRHQGIVIIRQDGRSFKMKR